MMLKLISLALFLVVETAAARPKKAKYTSSRVLRGASVVGNTERNLWGGGKCSSETQTTSCGGPGEECCKEKINGKCYHYCNGGECVDSMCMASSGGVAIYCIPIGEDTCESIHVHKTALDYNGTSCSDRGDYQDEAGSCAQSCTTNNLPAADEFYCSGQCLGDPSCCVESINNGGGTFCF